MDAEGCHFKEKSVTLSGFVNHTRNLPMETDKKEAHKHPDQDFTQWKESPFLLMKGFLMGSADIVPGVSGGTMALITGIYDRLINAIRSVDGGVIKSALRFRIKEIFGQIHWRFLFLLLSGIVLAVIFFTRIVPLQVYMFTHPEIVYGLFFGLILGSIYILLKEVNPGERNLKNGAALVLGALFGFWIVTLVPTDTPENFAFVFLSGAIAICAMILPGISGSYLLLILRKYDYVLGNLGELGGLYTFEAFMALVPFGLGAITGLALFSRLLSWLLKNYHATTLMVLVGFLVGSLYVIWPWQEREFEDSVRQTEVHMYQDDLVQELLENPDDENRPRYRRIGNIQNPDSPFPEFQRVEVEYVSRKMISTTPFIPGLQDNEKPDDPNIPGGATSMVIGLLMVGALDYLRRKG
jgi:putative membrane protein